MSRAVLLVASAFLVACTSRVDLAEASGGNGTGDAPGSSSGSTGTSLEMGTSLGMGTGSTTQDVAVEGSSSEDTGLGCAFLGCDDDDNGLECSTLQQDCPAGQKCTVVTYPGGPVLSETRCVPLVPDPDGIDEPCHLEDDSGSGIDSCDVGALCWHVDEETLEGRCVPYCVGSSHGIGCSDPNHYCPVYGDGILWICVPQCDPLDSSTCPAGEGCYPRDGRFTCAPVAPDGPAGLFEPCEYLNACAPGLMCINGEVVPGCETGGCCSPPCNLEAPDCPPLTECYPYFQPGDVVPGYEHVGLCRGEPAR